MTGPDLIAAAIGGVAMLIGIAILVLFTWALRVWGRHVAQRQGGVWWRRAAWIPFLGFGATAFGLTWTVIALMQTFDSISTMEPAQKATALDQGISQAMFATTVLLPVSGVLYVASIVVFMAGTLRRPTGSQG
jgi:hypothetical protein